MAESLHYIGDRKKKKHVLAILDETPGAIPLILCECAPSPITHIPGFIQIRLG